MPDSGRRLVNCRRWVARGRRWVEGGRGERQDGCCVCNTTVQTMCNVHSTKTAPDGTTWVTTHTKPHC